MTAFMAAARLAGSDGTVLGIDTRALMLGGGAVLILSLLAAILCARSAQRATNSAGTGRTILALAFVVLAVMAAITVVLGIFGSIAH